MRSWDTATCGASNEGCFTNTSTDKLSSNTPHNFLVQFTTCCYVCWSALRISWHISDSAFAVSCTQGHETADIDISSAGAVIMAIAYGIDVLPKDDPYVDIAERALVTLNATCNTGSYLGK